MFVQKNVQFFSSSPLPGSRCPEHGNHELSAIYQLTQGNWVVSIVWPRLTSLSGTLAPRGLWDIIAGSHEQLEIWAESTTLKSES